MVVCIGYVERAARVAVEPVWRVQLGETGRPAVPTCTMRPLDAGHEADEAERTVCVRDRADAVAALLCDEDGTKRVYTKSDGVVELGRRARKQIVPGRLWATARSPDDRGHIRR